MNKLWIVLILLVSFPAGAADEVFIASLTKCALNQMDMAQSGDFKILAAPEMNIVCTRTGRKLACKTLEKIKDKFQANNERNYEVYSQVGDLIEIRNPEDHYQSLVINQKLKKTMYFAKEFKSQTLIQETVCSGVLKNNEDVKNMLTPKASESKTVPKTPISIENNSPLLIGE